MTHSKVPKITDLSEEERKSVEKWIRDEGLAFQLLVFRKEE